MTKNRKHISVCICTYQRPTMLAQLLRQLCLQQTGELFTYSIVVADNDRQETARPVVQEFSSTAPIPVRYCVEPEQNIAKVRNQSVTNAFGDFVAFIDDDEEPTAEWLLHLFREIESSGADGVLGPVLPRFLTPPPEWIIRGNIFLRHSLPTGTWLRWDQTRSGNTLLRRSIFEDPSNHFRPEYGRGGEDVDFFRRMISKGMRFRWCAEAVAYEVVPPERWRRSYLLRRALLRGRAPYNQGWPVLKSLIAVPIYTLGLPFFLLAGQHVLMRYLIKECDHLGRIFTFLGVDLLPDRYVSK